MAMAEPLPMWWETRRDPIQLTLEIPIGPNSTSPKPAKVRKSCLFAFSAVILRILGVVVAVATLAYAAWTLYQIPKNLSLEPIVEVVAQGAFLIFIGGLSLLAELRTRWTMRGCLSTYILFSSYLARGIVYVALGAILWALHWFKPPVDIKQWYMGAGIIAIGVLNIVYYPFYWKHQRAVDFYKATPIPMEPYPEEIIYGMDEYINRKLGVATSPPVVQLGKVFEGANEVSPVVYNQKSLETETPGGPESIHIVVEPSVPSTITTSTTTSASNTTCAEEIRRSTHINTTVVETIPVESIGVGAS